MCLLYNYLGYCTLFCKTSFAEKDSIAKTEDIHTHRQTDRRTDTQTPTTGANLDIYRSGWFGLLAILLKTKALWFHEKLIRQFKDLQQKVKLDSQEFQGRFF